MKNAKFLISFTLCLFSLCFLQAQISSEVYLPLVQGNGTALKATADGTQGFSSAVRSIHGLVEAGRGYTFGVQGVATSSEISTDGRAYGVMGLAANADINYGLYGELQGVNRGAAVLGHVGPFTSSSTLFNGQWAGYFIGDVRVSNNIFAFSFNTLSDRKVKMGIEKIKKPMQKVMQIEGVTYQYDAAAFPNQKVIQGVQTGFIAQNIEKVIPDAVVMDQDGYKTVNYTKVVPLLVEAVKEQQHVIVELQEELAEIKELISNLNTNQEGHSIGALPKDKQSIQQRLNVFPNPASNKLTFALNGATKSNSAKISLLSNSGELLDSFSVKQKGTNVEYDISNLIPGVYYVSFQIDGQVVGTQQFIKQ